MSYIFVYLVISRGMEEINYKLRIKLDKMNSKYREANYDLLRLICTIAVITIHVSANYKNAITNNEIFGYLVEKNVITILLYNTLSRFAVPCFVMLSGAFLLSDDRNAEYDYLYKKCMKTIILPTLVFTVLYFLYSEAVVCAGIVIKGKSLRGILLPIKQILVGAPYYHMWYMYMIIGLYLLIPLILQVKNSFGEKKFLRISVVLMLVTSISGWTSTFELNWGIAKVICYIGYLMVGYQLRKYNINKKSNVKGFLFVIFGITILLGLTYIQYQHSVLGIAETDEKYSIVGNFNPLVVISSLLIFFGFSKLNINYDLRKIASLTFSIYLIHAGVWSFVWLLVRKTIGEGDVRLIIPISVCVVFAISYVLSVVYFRMCKLIEKRYEINE